MSSNRMVPQRDSTAGPVTLVTGASGLLGVNLVVAARHARMRVIAAYHRHAIEIPGVRCLSVDLSSTDQTNELIKALRPEWIVHCAALTNVDRCQTYPDEARRANVVATYNVAIAARDAGARLLYISTDSVFDGRHGDFVEDDAPSPVNVYGQTKLAGERIVRTILDGAVIVRTNIYGWNAQNKQSLAEWVLSRLASGEEVPGFCDVVFTPILVNDLAEILLNIMEQGLEGTYHVAGSEPCSKFDFAVHLAQVFHLDASLVQCASARSSRLAAPRPGNTSLRTARVALALGRAMPNVASGLRKFRSMKDSGFVDQLRAFARSDVPCQH